MIRSRDFDDPLDRVVEQIRCGVLSNRLSVGDGGPVMSFFGPLGIAEIRQCDSLSGVRSGNVGPVVDLLQKSDCFVARGDDVTGLSIRQPRVADICVDHPSPSRSLNVVGGRPGGEELTGLVQVPLPPLSVSAGERRPGHRKHHAAGGYRFIRTPGDSQPFFVLERRFFDPTKASQRIRFPQERLARHPQPLSLCGRISVGFEGLQLCNALSNDVVGCLDRTGPLLGLQSRLQPRFAVGYHITSIDHGASFDPGAVR
jgi:hypothetical protein